MEINKIYNMDCLIGMKDIKDESEEAIKARIEAEKKYFQNYTEFCENSTNKIDDISKRYGVN